MSPDDVIDQVERNYRKRRREQDPERWKAKAREYSRRYRAAHPEEARAYNREWMRRYRARQKELVICGFHDPGCSNDPCRCAEVTLVMARVIR